MTHTHTAQKGNVAYQHTGLLFGHDLPTAGVRHAANYHDSPRYCGDRYRTLCGRVIGGDFALYALAAGLAVTCKGCLAKIRAAAKRAADTRQCRYCGAAGLAGKGKELQREGRDNCLAYSCRDAEACGARIRQQQATV